MKKHSIAPLGSIPPIRLALSAIAIVVSLVFALAAFGVSVNTSFTYQGQLRRSGTAYSGTCDFRFALWDAVSGGAQQSGTQAINGVNVVNGLFTVELNFGDAFKGESRWLGTSVQCSGDSGFTQLDPRQPLNATPYALSLRPGARIEGGAALAAALRASNTGGGWGVEGTGSPGVFGNSIGGSGVYGQSAGVNSAGVRGDAFGPNSRGVYGSASGTDSAGVFGYNPASAAIWGWSDGVGSAIYGENTGTGFAGRFSGPVDIAGSLTVSSANLISVRGSTTNTTGSGVQGDANGGNAAGVFGLNTSGAGIWGRTTAGGSAVYGEVFGGGLAGRFIGPVNVQGTLTKSAGSFKIDHPLDPANKFLSHSFVESPDMMNIYNGNVTTDANGSATVTLPNYFAALNRDFRYQLTVLGQFAQVIVSRKIAGNTFEIRTDKPGVEVSWQVTGIRQDAYAKEHPIVVEELKPAEEKGLYLYPAGFGAGEEKRIGHLKGPAPAPGAQEAPAAESGDQSRSK